MTDTELTPNTFDTMKNRKQFIAGLLKCESYCDIHNLICKYPKYHKHLYKKYHLIFDVYNGSYIKLIFKNGLPIVNTDPFAIDTNWVDKITSDLDLGWDTFCKLEDHFDEVRDPED